MKRGGPRAKLTLTRESIIVLSSKELAAARGARSQPMQYDIPGVPSTDTLPPHEKTTAEPT
jgi:hypothetical protein